jgi:hypothetical protein
LVPFDMSCWSGWLVRGLAVLLAVAGLAACPRTSGASPGGEVQGVRTEGNDLAKLAASFRARTSKRPMDHAKLEALADAINEAKLTRAEVEALLGEPAWSIPLESGMAIAEDWRAWLPRDRAMDLLSYHCGRSRGASISLALVAEHGGQQRVLRAGVWEAHRE